MSKNLILLLLLLAVFLGFSGAYVLGGTQAYTRYQRSHVAVQRYCGGQAPLHICVHAPATIFSAFYPFYLATRKPLFTVEYSSTPPMKVIISVSINRFSDSYPKSVQAITEIRRIGFIPPMLPHALDNLTAEEHTSVHVTVSDLNARQYYYVNDIALTLHSRWLMQWTRENLPQIAAWVTPDDKAVAGLLENAFPSLKAQRAAPQGLIGYQHATPQQVIAQVDAIYDALLHSSIRYVQETVPYDGTDLSAGATEKILLPAEVLKQHSGMCIELTTLLASAVERIGLEAEIVLIPEHAFLGVAVTPPDTETGTAQFEYWDPAEVNNKVAADSANVAADRLYKQNAEQQTIVATIIINDAWKTGVDPMISSMP